MRRTMWRHSGGVICWIAGLSLPVAIAPGGVWAACARTPAAAATAGLAGSSAPFSVGDGEGFRAESERWDPVLQQRWTLVVNCAHPEWPAVEILSQALQSESPSSKQTAQQGAGSLSPMLPVVRAGDVVQLWSLQGDLRIEVAAMAEQNGGLGKTVRLRLMRRETLGPQIEEQFYGVVRGPHDVEIER